MDEGRQLIAKANFKHGRSSKSHLQQKHDLKAELRSIEADLIKTGLLKKDRGQPLNYWGGDPLKWASAFETRPSLIRYFVSISLPSFHPQTTKAV